MAARDEAEPVTCEIEGMSLIFLLIAFCGILKFEKSILLYFRDFIPVEAVTTGATTLPIDFAFDERDGTDG